MKPVDLTILIVHWNVWDLLRACLRSIENHSRAVPQDDRAARAVPAGTSDFPLRLFGPEGEEALLEVLVVDNASTDATVDLLPRLFPWVRLLRSPTNLGFTAGNNYGYQASRGRFVYFLNPDTELVRTTQSAGAFSDGLWQLYRAVRDDDRIALAGPQMRYPDNTVQSSRRRFPTPLTGFLESTWLGRAWPNNPWVRRFLMADWPDSFAHDVDWLVGAAMLARRSALEAIRTPDASGPFDEGFFMYSEELDLCRRLRAQGGRIVYIPQSVVVHYEGRSSEQVIAARHIRFNRSKIRYYRKYIGHGWASLLRVYLLLEFRWQFWLERLKWLLGHKRAMRAFRMEAYQEVLADGLDDSS